MARAGLRRALGVGAALALAVCLGCAAWPVEDRFRRPDGFFSPVGYDAKHTLLFVPDTLLEVSFTGKDVLSDLWDLPGDVFGDGLGANWHRSASRLAGDGELAFHGFAGLTRGCARLSAPELVTGARTLAIGVVELVPDTVTGAVATVFSLIQSPFRSNTLEPPSEPGARPGLTTVVAVEFEPGSDATGSRIMNWLGMVFTRRHILKRSDRVVWLLGEDSTPDRIFAALRQSAQRRDQADLDFFAHGSSGTISVRRGLTREQILSISQIEGLSLRSVVQMNCHGADLNDAWLKAGAAAVHSHEGSNNTHVYFIAKLMRHLSDGESMEQASARAWRKMVFEVRWTPVFYLDRWITHDAETRTEIIESGKVDIGGNAGLRGGPLDGAAPPKPPDVSTAAR